MICEHCSTELVDDECPSCDLYSAAVAAQQAAAQHIAKRRFPKAEGAILNEYGGVLAWVDGKFIQVGTIEEAMPFVALTRAVRYVTVFWKPPAPPRPPRRASARGRSANK